MIYTIYQTKKLVLFYTIEYYCMIVFIVISALSMLSRSESDVSERFPEEHVTRTMTIMRIGS